MTDQLSDIKGQAQVHAEVEEFDCYQIKNLKYAPDVILDIGANIGEFARFARKIFPKAFIVCVEPDNTNYANLIKFTPPKNIKFIKAAIGAGNVWRIEGSEFTGACFLSSGLGYPKEALIADPKARIQDIPILTLREIADQYVPSGEKTLLKVDIEGNEHTIFTHEPSMEVVRKMDYFAIEVHWYADSKDLLNEVRERTSAILKTLEATHTLSQNHMVWIGVKK